jgi:hypothetical protein
MRLVLDEAGCLSISQCVPRAETRFLFHPGDYAEAVESVNSYPTRWILSNALDFLQPTVCVDGKTA